MNKNEDKDLLRFTTCGSVDDGKSTLTGRLLFDTHNLAEDQLHALTRASLKRGAAELDLSLVTDGLKAEREQGITIDVAYRYFSTSKRKFILSDAPGHVQYTRNMVTGASSAHLALILVDARKGVVEQTRRHAFIASLLRIPHVVLCINKMDLVEFSQDRYAMIVEEFRDFASRLEVTDVQYIPVSALHGDNVVHRSARMEWYQGSTLMYYLENVHISSDRNHIDCRFPVQQVIRPRTSGDDFRGYAGQVAGGVFRKGDAVKVLPSGISTRIKSIGLAEQELEQAFSPLSVLMTLEDDVDVSRGDMLVRENNMPAVAQEIEVMLCWFTPQPLRSGTFFLIRHTTREVRCQVKEIRYTMDISNLRRQQGVDKMEMNGIGRVCIKTAQPLFFDSYRRNRTTGSLILIDETTFETVAAGMII
jgi:sulfate adenylyltransferase subunit 1